MLTEVYETLCELTSSTQCYNFRLAVIITFSLISQFLSISVMCVFLMVSTYMDLVFLVALRSSYRKQHQACLAAAAGGSWEASAA